MGDTRQRAIIVGAGNGLGRSLALRLAREGYDVALLARNQQRLESLAEEVRATGGDAEVVVCDASDLHQLAGAVAALATDGSVALLACNASVFGERLIDSDLDALQQATIVNVLAPVAAAQAARASLRATGGTVLLTGSSAGLDAIASIGVLSLGKSALRTVAALLADDLASDGIRVRTLVVDGAIEPGTPFDPDHIADAFWDFQADDGDEVERIFHGAPEA